MSPLHPTSHAETAPQGRRPSPAELRHLVDLRWSRLSSHFDDEAEHLSAVEDDEHTSLTDSQIVELQSDVEFDVMLLREATQRLLADNFCPPASGSSGTSPLRLAIDALALLPSDLTEYLTPNQCAVRITADACVRNRLLVVLDLIDLSVTDTDELLKQAADDALALEAPDFDTDLSASPRRVLEEYLDSMSSNASISITEAGRLRDLVRRVIGLDGPSAGAALPSHVLAHELALHNPRLFRSRGTQTG